jgi:hypothetical protein
MWIGYRSQEHLVKFGYRSERKVEPFRNRALFWPHDPTYCLNMATSSVFFFLTM